MILTEQDRADVQADIAKYRELLDDLENRESDRIVNVKQWYSVQAWLADEIRDLERQL